MLPDKRPVPAPRAGYPSRMPADRDDAPALTSEEADALRLAEELRDRIQRERETARLLGEYLEVSTTEIAELAVDPEA